jgi:hypothetical protein
VALAGGRVRGVGGGGGVISHQSAVFDG